MNKNEQIALENKHNKKSLINVVESEFSNLLNRYSEDKRNQTLDLLYVLMQKECQPIQNAISVLCSRGYTWEEAIDVLDKRSEDEIPLYKLTLNNSGNVTVDSNLRPTVTIVEAKSTMGVLPPLLIKPKEWNDHYDGGYYTQRHTAILGGGNQHDKYIGLDVLNKLQEIPWKLNTDILTYYKDTVVYDESRATSVTSELWGMPFYFMWQFDKRGRMYSKGYEVNLQGTEYHKAVLDFAEGEPLNNEGRDWLVTSIANAYGYDKLCWDERLVKGYEIIDECILVDDENQPISLVTSHADEPIMAHKLLQAFIDCTLYMDNCFTPVGYDATASGLQVMSCLTGCIKSAKAVNLVNTGTRADVYTTIANAMNIHLEGDNVVDRKMVKKPFMTHWYSSKAGPRSAFNDDQLEAFYDALNGAFTGAERFMNVVNSLWQDKDEFIFTAPDGHKAVIRMEITETATVELVEGVEFDYDYTVYTANGNPLHLCANIVHMYDAWVARELVRRCNFYVATIHDSFWCHPNNVSKMLQVYREILAELANSNWLLTTLEELAGHPVAFPMESEHGVLAHLILNSEYALS